MSAAPVQPWHRAAPGWRALLVFLAGSLVLMLLLWEHLGYRETDCSTQILVTRALARGRHLYRDITYPYGPVPAYLNAWLLRVFGDETFFLWHGALLAGVFTWAWARLGAAVLGDRAGWVVGLLMLAGYAPYPLTLAPYNFASFWAAGFVVFGLERAVTLGATHRVRDAALAGIFLGIAGAAKPATGGVVFLLLAPALWWSMSMAGPASGTGRSRLRLMAVFGAAAAAPVMLAFAPFAMVLTPDRFLDALFPSYLTAHYSHWRHVQEAGYPSFGGHLLAVAAWDRDLVSWDNLFLYAIWAWLHLGAVVGATVVYGMAVCRRRVSAPILVLSAAVLSSLVFVNIMANLVYFLALGALWWGALWHCHKWWALRHWWAPVLGGAAWFAAMVACGVPWALARFAPLIILWALLCLRWTARDRLRWNHAVLLGALPILVLCGKMLDHSVFVTRRGPQYAWIWRRDTLPDDLDGLRRFAAHALKPEDSLLCVNEGFGYVVLDRLPPVRDYHWVPAYLSDAEERALEARVSAREFALIVVGPEDRRWPDLRRRLRALIRACYRKTGQSGKEPQALEFFQAPASTAPATSTAPP